MTDTPKNSKKKVVTASAILLIGTIFTFWNWKKYNKLKVFKRKSTKTRQRKMSFLERRNQIEIYEKKAAIYNRNQENTNDNMRKVKKQVRRKVHQTKTEQKAQVDKENRNDDCEMIPQDSIEIRAHATLAQLFILPLTPKLIIACTRAITTIADSAYSAKKRYHLTCNPRNPKQSEKGKDLIETLCRILFFDDPSSANDKISRLFIDLKQQVIRALGNLSIDHNLNRYTIAKNKGINGLIELASLTADLSIQKNVCATLGNLINDNIKLKELMIEAGGIDVLLKALTLATESCFPVVSNRSHESKMNVPMISNVSSDMTLLMGLSGLEKLTETTMYRKHLISHGAVKTVVNVGKISKLNRIPNSLILEHVIMFLLEFTHHEKNVLIDGGAVPLLNSLLAPECYSMPKIQIESIRTLRSLVLDCPPSAILPHILSLLPSHSPKNNQIDPAFPSDDVMQEAISTFSILAEEPFVANLLLNSGLPNLIFCAESICLNMKQKALIIMQMLAKHEHCERLFNCNSVLNVLDRALHEGDNIISEHAFGIIQNLSLRPLHRMPIAKCTLELVLELIMKKLPLEQSEEKHTLYAKQIPSVISIILNILSAPHQYESKDEEIEGEITRKEIAIQVASYAHGVVLKQLSQSAETGDTQSEKNFRLQAGRALCELCQTDFSREFFWGATAATTTAKNVIYLMLEMIKTSDELLWYNVARALAQLADSHSQSFWKIASQENIKYNQSTNELNSKSLSLRLKGMSIGHMSYFTLTQLLEQVNTLDGKSPTRRLSISQQRELVQFTIQAIRPILSHATFPPDFDLFNQLKHHITQIKQTYQQINDDTSTNIISDSDSALELLQLSNKKEKTSFITKQIWSFLCLLMLILMLLRIIRPKTI